MRQRFAAQSVIEQLLRQQDAAPGRSSVSRLFGRTPLGIDSVAWYVGARGEIAVGVILARLSPEWSVFHALPVGNKDTDIDHLVIGPGGIFTINTKHHSGKSIWVAGKTFLVSGQKKAYIAKSESEAANVTKLLRERMPQLLPARPIITLVDPKQITVKDKPQLVTVINARDLRQWLTKLPAVLSAADVAEVDGLIDDPAFWRALPADIPENLMGRFTELDFEVRSARTRRTLWAFAGIAATIGLAIFALPPLTSAVGSLILGLFS